MLSLTVPLSAGWAETPDKAAVQGKAPKKDLSAVREKLNRYAEKLAGCSPAMGPPCEVPTEALVKMMGPAERKGLAKGAACLYDRLLSTNGCSAAEVEWSRCALSLLRVDDGPEVEAVMRRVYSTPLHEVDSLEKLGKIERLIKAVHPGIAASGQAEPEAFERSSVKKSVIRRQLFLMGRRAQ